MSTKTVTIPRNNLGKFKTDQRINNDISIADRMINSINRIRPQNIAQNYLAMSRRNVTRRASDTHLT